MDQCRLQKQTRANNNEEKQQTLSLMKGNSELLGADNNVKSRLRGTIFDLICINVVCAICPFAPGPVLVIATVCIPLSPVNTVYVRAVYSLSGLAGGHSSLTGPAGPDSLPLFVVKHGALTSRCLSAGAWWPWIWLWPWLGR